MLKIDSLVQIGVELYQRNRITRSKLVTYEQSVVLHLVVHPTTIINRSPDNVLACFIYPSGLQRFNWGDGILQAIRRPSKIWRVGGRRSNLHFLPSGRACHSTQNDPCIVIDTCNHTHLKRKSDLRIHSVTQCTQICQIIYGQYTGNNKCAHFNTYCKSFTEVEQIPKNQSIFEATSNQLPLRNSHCFTTVFLGHHQCKLGRYQWKLGRILT